MLALNGRPPTPGERVKVYLVNETTVTRTRKGRYVGHLDGTDGCPPGIAWVRFRTR